MSGLHFQIAISVKKEEDKNQSILHQLFTCDFLVGMVVLRDMSLVKTPPRVSIPNDSGVTSRSRTSVTSPARTPPWTAAPIATASSGFTARDGTLPNISCTVDCTWQEVNAFQDC